MEGRPQGLIRLHIPSGFGRLHIMPFVPDFLASYPDIHLDVSLTDVRVDLLSVGADLAIRIGSLMNSSILSRKLAPHRRIACASPTYLDGLPPIAEPINLLRLKPNGDVLFDCSWRSAMSRLGILRATALSLALVVATPAFAAGFRDVSDAGAMRVGNDGLGGIHATIGSAVSTDSDASFCCQRWACHDAATGKYMGDDGMWRTCP
jgi:DNA-binding transcriptional LysR family regulator